MKGTVLLTLLMIVVLSYGGTLYGLYDQLCRGNQNGFLRHPVDCHKFIRCSHQRAYEFHCPANLLWHHEIKSCDYAYRTECKVNEAKSKSEKVNETKKLTNTIWKCNKAEIQLKAANVFSEDLKKFKYKTNNPDKHLTTVKGHVNTTYNNNNSRNSTSTYSIKPANSDISTQPFNTVTVLSVKQAAREIKHVKNTAESSKSNNNSITQTNCLSASKLSKIATEGKKNKINLQKILLSKVNLTEIENNKTTKNAVNSLYITEAVKLADKINNENTTKAENNNTANVTEETIYHNNVKITEVVKIELPKADNDLRKKPKSSFNLKQDKWNDTSSPENINRKMLIERGVCNKNVKVTEALLTEFPKATADITKKPKNSSILKEIIFEKENKTAALATSFPENINRTMLTENFDYNNNVKVTEAVPTEFPHDTSEITNHRENSLHLKEITPDKENKTGAVTTSSPENINRTMLTEILTAAEIAINLEDSLNLKKIHPNKENETATLATSFPENINRTILTENPDYNNNVKTISTAMPAALKLILKIPITAKDEENKHDFTESTVELKDFLNSTENFRVTATEAANETFVLNKIALKEIFPAEISKNLTVSTANPDNSFNLTTNFPYKTFKKENVNMLTLNSIENSENTYYSNTISPTEPNLTEFLQNSSTESLPNSLNLTLTENVNVTVNVENVFNTNNLIEHFKATNNSENLTDFKLTENVTIKTIKQLPENETVTELVNNSNIDETSAEKKRNTTEVNNSLPIITQALKMDFPEQLLNSNNTNIFTGFTVNITGRVTASADNTDNSVNLTENYRDTLPTTYPAKTQATNYAFYLKTTTTEHLNNNNTKLFNNNNKTTIDNVTVLNENPGNSFNLTENFLENITEAAIKITYNATKIINKTTGSADNGNNITETILTEATTQTILMSLTESTTKSFYENIANGTASILTTNNKTDSSNDFYMVTTSSVNENIATNQMFIENSVNIQDFNETVLMNASVTADNEIDNVNIHTTAVAASSIDNTTVDPRLPFRSLECQGLNNRRQFMAFKCYQYYQCFAGWAFLLNCHEGWRFEVKRGQCILDVNEECEL